MATTDPTLEHLADRIAAATRVVVLTGAGVSTASGVPDFRGPQGLWTRDPSTERLASIDAYVSEPDVRREAWRGRLAGAQQAVAPNPAHEALAELERLERLDRLITQNVDGLHQDAGNDPDRIVEVHGTLREATCLGCGWRGAMEPILDRVRAGEEDPHCTACDGLLKSATISFGQALEPDDLQRAHEATVAAEVFLAVGSSLVVHPIAMLPQLALDTGAQVGILNGEPTGYDDRADTVLRGDVSALLPDLVAQVRQRL